MSCKEYYLGQPVNTVNGTAPDGAGNVALELIKALSIAGTTITVTKQDGTIYELDTQDTKYTLPIASASVLGGVKVGSNLSISNGVLSGAAPYTHPTSSGNKHVPSGGASGNFLGWSADGTAKWVGNPNTNTSCWSWSGGTPGWARDNSTGLTIQWGKSVGQSITFPRAFATVAYSIVQTAAFDSGSYWNGGFTSLTQTNAKFVTEGGFTGQVYWIAIGVS